jgi:hypothetical protein
MPDLTVRLIKHQESYEVRLSTFFYFDDNLSRRSVSLRASPQEALEDAIRYARELTELPPKAH